MKTKQHLIPTSLSFDTFNSQWPRSAKALRSPLIASTYKDLTYDRANSSVLQTTSTRSAHRQVIVNDTTDLGEGLPVINDTTDLSEGLPVINNTTDLSEGLPVINNTTNLSEGLPVINNTSTKITCVVVFLNNV